MTQVLQHTGNEEILNQPQVLAIAQGSPGEAITAWQQLQRFQLTQQVTPGAEIFAMLELARQIDKTLIPAQLWLVDYLQHCYWQHSWQGQFINRP